MSSKLFPCIAFFLLLPASFVSAQTSGNWQMPLTLSDSNTRISYQYTAMGQDYSGKSTGVTGRFSLSGTDPRSIHGTITIPTPDPEFLASGGLGALGAAVGNVQLPPLVLVIDSMRNLCLPSQIDAKHPCLTSLDGTTHFGSSVHNVSIPVKITRERNGFILQGQQQLDTAKAARQSPLAHLIESAEADFQVRIPAT